MDVKRIVVVGARGRMGAEIIKVINGDAELVLAGAVERPDHPEAGAEIHGRGSVVAVSPDLGAISGSIDAIIDFSAPESSLNTLGFAARRGVPVVVGTTGFSREQLLEAEVFARKTAVLISPNMSVGVNLLFRIVELTAGFLPDSFDAEVFEIHHRHKKDAPSGTARRLVELIHKARGGAPEEIKYPQRMGITGERKRGETGVSVLRGGEVVGEHTVFFFGDNEQIELSHRARSRAIFAEGAVLAAKKIIGKPPKLYTFSEIIFGHE
ncbi:MAG: 4-hydroxy-tetrahydrodipicolinate reductase [Deltaproteobacteria bacterium]|nr:4-hydroxy-tetrahydrodipicolinate reductase [Deltaproteobacteria bacterium]